jgi:hypothetical protein
MSRRGDESRAEIAARRRGVEERLAALRGALATETGLAPARRGWVVAVVAAAAGLAIALRRRRPAPELPPAVG